MDPKMDAGMTGSAANTLEEAIEKGFAPTNLSVLDRCYGSSFIMRGRECVIAMI